MKIYKLNTVINFGRYKGETLRDIIEKKDTVVDIEGEKITIPNLANGYIDWCIINLKFFLVNYETLKELKLIKPNFILSLEARKELIRKNNRLVIEEGKGYFQGDDSFNYYADDEECGSCGEFPCMCSDPEQTSTIFD